MIHIVLIEPEIPPNTGNIARTCAATDTPLHLVGPLGFSITDKHVKRAGLDYWDALNLYRYDDLEQFWAQHIDPNQLEPALMTTKGDQRYTEIELPRSDEDLFLLFGPETRGLPQEIRSAFPQRQFRIPMAEGNRSLNLSNSVAIVLYDLLRRVDFLTLR